MKKILMAAAAAMVAGSAGAAIIYGTAGATYAEDFDGLPNSGSSAAWTDNSTLAGWYLVDKNGATPSTIAVGTGSGTAGSFYSFGASSASDRALGGLGSGGTYFGEPATGAVAGYWGVKLTNNTGETLTSFTVTYDMEQWRNGGNTSAQPLVSSWAINPSNWISGSWGTGASTDSPIATSSGTALDGNLSANRVAGVTFTATSVSWAQGETLWVRFRELNDSGSDHGLSVDNFSLSAIPEPGTLSLVVGIGFAMAVRMRRRKV